MAGYRRQIIFVVCLIASAFTGYAQLAAQTSPSATLKMSSESAGIFFGWHDGAGVLTLKDGSEYEVTMDAYSLLSIGYAKAAVTGNIYNLKTPSDFAGEYFTTGQSTAFKDGKGDAVFTNDKDVRIELVSKETGFRAGLNFGSATFKLGKKLMGSGTPPPMAKAVPTTPVEVTPLPVVAKPPVPKMVVKEEAPMKAVPIKPVMKIPTQYILNFGFNKAKLNRAMGSTLDSVIKDWKGKAAVFHIIGHADKVGSKKYNSRLSQKRADAVKRALKARGVPVNNIVAVGVGHTVPAVATQEGQRLRANRRAVLTVLPPK